jgi:ribose transport system ATP-binding protein
MLAVERLSKSYVETRALDDVSIVFEPGAAHAILGENGSGKSTLVKLLTGITAPSGGRILMDRRPLAASTPAEVQAAGVATVFQEVLVAPDRSVAENILLGRDSLLRWGVRPSQRRAVAAKTLSRLTSTPIDVEAPAGGLPLNVRQLIVLAWALVWSPRALILDEITAALDFGDREVVFQVLERFAADGGLILFMSHRMDEVMRLAHRVSVLRSGRLVETLPLGGTSPEALLRLTAPESARELAHGA